MPSGMESWEGTGVFEPDSDASKVCGAVFGISCTEDSLRASCRIGIIGRGTGEDSACASMFPERITHAHTTPTLTVSEYSMVFFLISQRYMLSRFRYFPT